jgi:hypothetical protein
MPLGVVTPSVAKAVESKEVNSVRLPALATISLMSAFAESDCTSDNFTTSYSTSTPLAASSLWSSLCSLRRRALLSVTFLIVTCGSSTSIVFAILFRKASWWVAVKAGTEANPESFIAAATV